MPLLLLADNMENAAASLRLKMLDSWKRENGWSMHGATIVPFQKEFIEQTLGMVNQGIITLDNDPAERQKFFNFDSDNTSADIQDVTGSDRN